MNFKDNDNVLDEVTIVGSQYSFCDPPPFPHGKLLPMYFFDSDWTL